MSLAYWCIAMAAVLPYVALGFTMIPSKTEPSRLGKGWDNRDPRGQAQKLVGWRKRASNAQTNSYEIFPAFAASVLMAQTVRGPSFGINAWALAFVGLRVLYAGCYLTDLASARSTIWSLAAGCVVALFGIAAGV